MNKSGSGPSRRASSRRGQASPALAGSAPRARASARSAVQVARRVHFSAAHRLWNPQFTEDENWSTFGNCNNPKGHGHNYTLEVTVRGPIDPDTGFVVDLAVLKRVLDERIVKRVDHKHLNEDVDFLRGVNPTAENLAVCFWNEICDHIPAGSLYRVRVYESERNFADYFGEEC